MRNKYVRCVLPMNIQFFADPGDGGGSAGGTGGTGEEPNGGQQSFDDFLKGDGNQEEFNRRVQKAVNIAVDQGFLLLLSSKSQVPHPDHLRMESVTAMFFYLLSPTGWQQSG